MNPFFTAIARGAEDVAQSNGYSLAVFNTDEDPAREEASLEIVGGELAAGVILATTNMASASVRAIVELGIPLVAIDRRLTSGVGDLVGLDNVTASYDAVSHLIALGHTRIGILAGHEGISTGDDRLEGYAQAHREHGLSIDQAMIRRAGFRESGGRTETVALLSLDAPPTAIYALSNVSAMGLLRTLRERRVRIPEQMSVVAFDDLVLGDLLDPPITTVKQPAHQMGMEAAGLLLRRIADPKAPEREVLLSGRLVVRESTAAAIQMSRV
jgi:DNA-binding LacI/PurR family transcriptional regulator